MKRRCYTFFANGKSFECFLDEKGTFVSDGQEEFFSLFSLTQKYPFLKNSLLVYAQLANFFFKGTEFLVVESPLEFQKQYRERIHNEDNYFGDIPPRISDYGIFDITVMHQPKVVDKTFVFFVEHQTTHLPYKVTMSYPSVSKKPTAKYSLLPLTS